MTANHLKKARAISVSPGLTRGLASFLTSDQEAHVLKNSLIPGQARDDDFGQKKFRFRQASTQKCPPLVG
jgi:hypothetical protein